MQRAIASSIVRFCPVLCVPKRLTLPSMVKISKKKTGTELINSERRPTTILKATDLHVSSSWHSAGLSELTVCPDVAKNKAEAITDPKV
mmetsp:Transcript_80770/g.179478  ORF Transcript_80770/g.179478 Transcript_80770/m.179478 type:complete len:89 (-) Transcript_80770:251-517(-)